jgi:DegV family protein with EDD domain
MQSAELAARSVADAVRVEVVDSRSVTMGLGSIVVAAARRAREGADVDEVAGLARDLAARTKVWGALDTLENLKKGGRIGNARAMLGTVLSIKPIIEVRDGVVEEGGKQRTRAKALAFLVDKVRSAGAVEQLAVMHADCSDVDQFVAMLAEVYPGEIIVGEIGPVVGAHAGRGTIGVGFQA